MNSEDEQDLDVQRLKKMCEELGEHFDCVQIFASRFDAEEGTTSVNWGAGNWHARRGQVDGWLTKEDERSRKEIREQE